jgi:cutinase
VGVAIAAAAALHAGPMPTADAAPCPDAEVVFARGTTESPGLGPTGDAFVDSLRSRMGAKSLGVYAVDYPAAMDFATAIDGIYDARAHILSTVANCPKTKLVLGGFSQGAAVMGFVTANVVPDGVSPQDVPTPMPADVADHVTAVALFGKPSPRFMKAINDPSIVIGPQYVSKTVDLCVDNDLVCDPEGRSFSVHNQYAETGTVDQGATFVANRLQAAWTADEAAAAAAAAAVPTPTPAPQTASRPTPAPLSAPFDGSSPSAHLGWATTLPGPPPLPGPTAADALPPS